MRDGFSFNTLRRQTGFSLIELLVVLTIIALLGAVVGPQVMRHLGRAKVDTTRLQIEDLGAALDLYYLNNGGYPSSDMGLASLIFAPAGRGALERALPEEEKASP